MAYREAIVLVDKLANRFLECLHLLLAVVPHSLLRVPKPNACTDILLERRCLQVEPRLETRSRQMQPVSTIPTIDDSQVALLLQLVCQFFTSATRAVD